MPESSLPPLKCKFCSKEFTKQERYDTHKLLCIECDSKTSQDPIDLDQSEIISNVSLRKVIMELVKSNNQLRKEVNELKKWVQTKKKKIVVIDWLNINCKPEQSYKEYMTNLVIERSDLKIIFDSGLIDGIDEILKVYMSRQTKEGQIVPFSSFDQKNNTLYVYTENGKWELLSPKDFNTIISRLSQQILQEFGKWKDENEEKLCDEDFSSIYIQNTKKVIGGDIPIDKIRNKIQNNLYKYLKKNLQNTIEYEFS